MTIFILLGLVVLFIYIAFNSKNKSVLNDHPPRITMLKMAVSYDDNGIYQAFESLYIVDTSSNIATVKSRLPFIHDLFVSFESIGLSVGHWPERVAKMEIMYNQAYINRPLNEGQREAVLNPTLLLNNWRLFTENVILQTTKRHIIAQEVIISALKTKKAIGNRYIKMAQELQGVIEEMSNPEFKEEAITLQKAMLLKAE